MTRNTAKSFSCASDDQPHTLIRTAFRRDKLRHMSNETAGQIPAPPDVAGAPDDAQVTGSGLASKVVTAGSGEAHPTAASTVTVHYTGWTTDGKMFDSSVVRGQPASFPLSAVIKGWTEGLQLMVAGEKRRFWIPGDLAYGNTPQGGRPYGTLVFDVELISF